MMKKGVLIAIYFSTSLMLQGCAVVLIGAGAGAGATSVITDSRSAGTQLDDSTLYSRASNKLNNNKKLFIGSRIILSTYNGNVLMTGQASGEQISKADTLIKEISGVNKIYNQITNGSPISSKTIANDGWITTKIKSQLITKTGTQALKIKVVTEDGTVFLIGNISKYMGKTIAEITSKVYGVRRVITIFNYTDE